MPPLLTGSLKMKYVQYIRSIRMHVLYACNNECKRNDLGGNPVIIIITSCMICNSLAVM